jgi:hypothetical protein
MDSISKQHWRKYNMVAIEDNQRSGDILTLWNPKILNLIAAEETKYTIMVHMQIIGNTEEILCKNVYGLHWPEGKKGMI